MYRFDEATLVSELAAVSSRARVAFAAAAATRQLANYERIARQLNAAKAQRPREVADQLWADLQRASIDHDLWSREVDEVMSLLPEESDVRGLGHALADDALSSLAYAIRCLLTREPQEAAWAARRAYEAADQAAIGLLGVQPGGSQTNEIAIQSHTIVQRELARQREDLALLCDESIDKVRERALKNRLLSESESASISWV